MSWTNIYPYLDENTFEAYRSGASTSEKKSLTSLFRVAQVHEAKKVGKEIRRCDPPIEPAQHLLAVSLFWKPLQQESFKSPPLSREFLQNPLKYGFKTRYQNPWEHYIEPLFQGAQLLGKARPDVAFRVYLANDLAFLIPELTDAGCEVYLMENSSIGMQPGTMWRFLAMEHNGLVTIIDSDRASSAVYDVERTEIAAEAGLPFWRVAYTLKDEDTPLSLPERYRPILACHFGSTKSYPMTELMCAFIWHCQKDTMPNEIRLSSDEKRKIFHSEWPNYGFDEWFLLAALYPRIAFGGVLTFVPWKGRNFNQWFALDIEYCTWANPKSEIFFHDGMAE